MAGFWADSGRFRKGKGGRECRICRSFPAKAGHAHGEPPEAAQNSNSVRPLHGASGRSLRPLARARVRIAPKVAAEIESWLGYLGAERRMSPKTVEAYRRDVLQFLGFLAEHLGGAPSLQASSRR